jgi:hypothetical protein
VQVRRSKKSAPRRSTGIAMKVARYPEAVLMRSTASAPVRN